MEPELEPTDPTQHMEVVLDPTDPAANGDPFVIETTLWDLVEGLQIEADCIAATEAEADAMVVAAVVALAGVAAQGHSDVVAA